MTNNVYNWPEIRQKRDSSGSGAGHESTNGYECGPLRGRYDIGYGSGSGRAATIGSEVLISGCSPEVEVYSSEFRGTVVGIGSPANYDY